MAFSGKTDKMHNIVYILIVLISCTLADVAFVTKPPEEVRTFPGQHVTLPCVLENLTENQNVRWILINNILYQPISINRNVLITRTDNVGEHFSIIGDGMNFTLLFNIPDTIEFGSDLNVTTLYMCSVLTKPNTNVIDISAISNVIIQRNFNAICGKIKTYYVIGNILILGCYNDSDPTIITTLKSGNGKVLPTYLDKTHYIMHNLTLTKEDHNAMFVCESRRNVPNEIKNCSMGPITVNYKPEINITQTSATEFHCTAEARPPVNEKHWIMEPSIPQDSFTISNDVLRITEPLKSEMKITCEAENSIGKDAQTLIIPVDNQDDEIIPRQDEDDGNNINRVVIIVVSVLFCVALVVVSFYLYKFKQCKILKTANDDAIIDQSLRTEEDGYQIPVKSVHEHYQSLKIAESMNAKEDEKVVVYDIVSPNEEGQSLEVASSSTTYVNTLDNKNPCQINKIDSDPTSKAKGEEVTYVNNPRVKKCQFPGNVQPTNIGNEEHDDKETDTDYETVPNLVIPDKSSHHSETTADVHYINLKVKASQWGRQCP